MHATSICNGFNSANGGNYNTHQGNWQSGRYQLTSGYHVCVNQLRCRRMAEVGEEEMGAPLEKWLESCVHVTFTEFPGDVFLCCLCQTG